MEALFQLLFIGTRKNSMRIKRWREARDRTEVTHGKALTISVVLHSER
jgi:hypothetical protein